MFLAAITGLVCILASATPDVSAYPSIQAAIDANPGQMIFVPGGDYTLSETLRIVTDNTGLYGYGRLLQTNPKATILDINGAAGVRIRDLTFQRAPGAEDAEANGIICRDARNVTLENLRVQDCRARAAAVELRDCRDCTVRNCDILNYKRIAVDDRTESPLYGYAFKCIDGTGILVTNATGTVLESNRVTEERLLPTREIMDQFQLGELTDGRYPTNPGQLAAEAKRYHRVTNWHQGSAIVVTGPETTRHTRIQNNHLVNAAQGIDMHCDHAVVTGNVVDHAMIGLKMTHGCRNIILANNLVTHVDLWGIVVNPGAASHAAEPATPEHPARDANVDAGILIEGNIITDFGYGNDFWNWGGRTEEHDGAYAIAFLGAQLDTNPPLTDILVRGNMVYNTGRDGIVENGEVKTEGPRYHLAVYRDAGKSPVNLQFDGNLFHPGVAGIANFELNGADASASEKQ